LGIDIWEVAMSAYVDGPGQKLDLRPPSRFQVARTRDEDLP
jgi:hypothetical protein